MRFIKVLQSYWHKKKIQKQLILCFMITIMLMGTASLYSYYSMSVLMKRVNTTFEVNVKLNNLHKNLDNLQYAFENYLASKYSKSLEDYYKGFNQLKKESDAMQMEYMNIENMLMMKDIKNMIDTYLAETDATVTARRGREVEAYLLHNSESVKIYGYINEYIDRLNSRLFLQNTTRYLTLKNNFYLIETLNMSVFVSVLFFNIILILWFVYRITKPISDLSRLADEISRGNFDVPEVKADTDDEIGIMARAFNRMTSSIRQYIGEIKEKAELESRLRERELENLTMKSNLREAELHALQAQINPHFLFNTLNTGAQLAMLEGADRACTFIENAAELFRYNIRNLDKPVTLGDEIKNIENYIYLLKVRFGDKVKFVLDIDSHALDVKIPCLILQPIVENAFVHGMGDMERDGRICLKVVKQDQWVDISITDNGKGISEKRIRQILYEAPGESMDGEEIHKGHTTGIGLRNIHNRLKIFYTEEKVMDIHSTPGQGTEVILHLPVKSL